MLMQNSRNGKVRSICFQYKGCSSFGCARILVEQMRLYFLNEASCSGPPRKWNILLEQFCQVAGDIRISRYKSTVEIRKSKKTWSSRTFLEPANLEQQKSWMDPMEVHLAK
ncbi:hypothetical protein BASA83_011381 [Batrachochytrium salamandrivorans]|nr:hypothetical protein BASA83_011381 [Batrachochytrium salamandrivorans]